jgi:hypothetical protein
MEIMKAENVIPHAELEERLHFEDVDQKDLGPETAALATTMNEYNPDESWSKAAE